MGDLRWTVTLALIWLAFTSPTLVAETGPVPLLTRIKMATIGAPDLAAVEAWYTQWLNQKVRERGRVSAAMAASWGAPNSEGRDYLLMSSDAVPNVFLRAVQTDAVAGYRPLTTWGWNSFEIVVNDVYQLRESLKDSPFEIIGEPHPLSSIPRIHAMQVIGPASEVLYLTTETGDRDTSVLPATDGSVGRLFILVLGGPDIVKLRDWYGDTFAMQKPSIRVSTAQVVQRAWGLPDGTHPITLLRLREHGNSIQLDGYTGGLGARSVPEGQLPPGNAMAAFSVDSLDAIDVDFITPPATLPGVGYGGHRAATFVGPAGELTELIEDPRPETAPGLDQ